MTDHLGPVILEHGALRAIDCWVCGYAHLIPLPTEAALAEYYRDEFYHEGRPLLEQRQADRWYWRLVFRERMREFERLAPSEREIVVRGRTEILPRSILDYGAGLGWFVKFAQMFGDWAAEGYEPADCEHVTWAVHDHLPSSRLLKSTFGDAFQYEAIHCSLVLEHVRDPVATLRQMHDLLLPGGVLCVIVPNEFNELQNRLRRWGYSPLNKEHVNYFTPETLRPCLERAGFEVLRETASFPIEWFALHGLNYVKFPSTGKVAHTLRMLFEAALLTLAPGLKRRLYERWARKGVGREVEVWARKSG